MWWIKEEVKKYKNKKVKYNNSTWTVIEVFWRKQDEEFVYWIKDSKGILEKVFDKNLELISY